MDLTAPLCFLRMYIASYVTCNYEKGEYQLLKPTTLVRSDWSEGKHGCSFDDEVSKQCHM